MKSNMKSNSVFFGSLVASILASVTILAPFPAQSEEAAYQYVVPGGGDMVYRVNKTTGEVTACQFGTTQCLAPGPGAGPQAPGNYRLEAREEGGVSRVNDASKSWVNDASKQKGVQVLDSFCKSVSGSLCCCPGTQLCDANRVCH